jgi:thiazole synthase
MISTANSLLRLSPRTGRGRIASQDAIRVRGTLNESNSHLACGDPPLTPTLSPQAGRGSRPPLAETLMVNFYGKSFASRLLVGSALYPSPAIMQEAIRASGSQIVTVSLRREAAGGKTGDAFWKLIRELDVTVLPNTAGCRSVREAITTAKLARELFGTSWIKLEVIADNDTLQPDVVGLVEAATILIKDGFEVFPYCTEDLSVATRLVDAGCKVVMPWAAPIGSAKGITNRDALKLLRDRLPDITLVVDAGIGAPSHAAHALELGFDAVLLNTAIAKAADPVAMANAFRLGVEAGRAAHEAGLMEARDFASPSTPVVGTPFWHAVS